MRAGDGDRSLMMQPAVSLAYGHRYVVALRGVVDGSGETIPASPAFAALRDGTDSDEPSVDERRGLYADIFARLDEVGVERETLQLAWDFTVASREETNGRLVHMRDVALEQAGDAGPTYEILSVDEDVSADIFRRIEGEIEVPLFLDIPGPGGLMTVDDDGQPEQNGTARYPVHDPGARTRRRPSPRRRSRLATALFGSRDQAESSTFGSYANAGEPDHHRSGLDRDVVRGPGDRRPHPLAGQPGRPQGAARPPPAGPPQLPACHPHDERRASSTTRRSNSTARPCSTRTRPTTTGGARAGSWAPATWR